MANPNLEVNVIEHKIVLTKREYFAAAAMNGCCVSDRWSPEDCSEFAVRAADALIAELNKTTEVKSCE